MKLPTSIMCNRTRQSSTFGKIRVDPKAFSCLIRVWYHRGKACISPLTFPREVPWGSRPFGISEADTAPQRLVLTVHKEQTSLTRWLQRTTAPGLYEDQCGQQDPSGHSLQCCSRTHCTLSKVAGWVPNGNGSAGVAHSCLKFQALSCPLQPE